MSQYVFLAGAISGLAEGMSIQPLELLKTRFQINEGKPLKIIPTVKEIFREGGLLQFYRGGLPEIAGLIPRATAALSTLEFSRRTFRSWHAGELPTPYAYLSGGLCGITEGIVFSPFQVIKVRLMAKEHLGRYKNTLDCLAKVVSAEGISALTIGLGPTLWRNCIWNSLYYGTMFEVDKRLKPLDNAWLEAGRTIAVGTGVGVMATCFNAPFDVVKSRFQSQLPTSRKYTSTFSTLATIYREEGPRSLYKGFVPKAVRLGVGQSIGLMTFQNCLVLFDAKDKS
mmetsp:Transcript_2283/g.5111  ORF Transcript_2283/g.5111 Transcript_2283/m.5111 type:complete len:283 (+) Transcript_2283:59-907(+)